MSNATISSTQTSTTNEETTQAFMTTTTKNKISQTTNEYKLTELEIKQFQQRFNSFDKNGDGKITIDELKSIEKSLEMYSTQERLQEEFTAGDIDGNGYIDFHEFCIGMQKQKEKDLKKTEKDIKNTFNTFDKDKNQAIDEIELQEGFEMLGIDRTDRQFDGMMHTYDVDHDGLLSYPEFYKLVLNEASQTEVNDISNNDSKFAFKFHIPDVNPMYYFIGTGVFGLLMFICIIRAICRCKNRKKGKLYNSLTTKDMMDEERYDREVNDLMYEL